MPTHARVRAFLENVAKRQTPHHSRSFRGPQTASHRHPDHLRRKRYGFGAALNLRSAPIGTTVSRGSALTPGLAVWLREASADVPAHVLPDRFATTPSMAVRKLFCK
jgi:hypothetical protein